LIILPASGNGTFHANFVGARALVRGLVSTHPRSGKTYLNIDNLEVQLGVKDVNMRVRKVFNNNRILSKLNCSRTGIRPITADPRQFIDPESGSRFSLRINLAILLILAFLPDNC
jgi:hypothetical protein